MATVQHWTGAETRKLRAAMRMTVRAFAEHLGVDSRTVNKWEARGTDITLRPDTQAMLDSALRLADPEVQTRFERALDGFQTASTGRHDIASPAATNLPELLGITPERLPPLSAHDQPTLADTPPSDHAVALEDMKRRTLMKWGLATTAASLSATRGTAVGVADVKRLERAAARLHNLDQRHGGDTLWRAALAHAHEGMQLLEHGSYTNTVEVQLLAASGRLQICAGWLALDAGQHHVARICFGEALAMGYQANNAEIETRALANLAFQSNVLERPREALRYATGAERAANSRGAAPWLVAIPQFRLAIGNSLSGDARDADRAITGARRAFEKAVDDPTEEWSAFLSSTHIDGIEATCAIGLGSPVRAERLLEQAIAGYGRQFARNLLEWRVRLARARLDRGEIDGAAEAAHDILDDLTNEVASWRVSIELDAVTRRLAEYPGVEGVEHFLTRYQALSQ